jgi:hypothetical protein
LAGYIWPLWNFSSLPLSDTWPLQLQRSPHSLCRAGAAGRSPAAAPRAAGLPPPGRCIAGPQSSSAGSKRGGGTGASKKVRNKRAGLWAGHGGK